MKGQEDAPFEVLIGIIIFVFVLSISSYLFEDYNRYQTEAKLDVEMNNLANLIESVYSQAPGSKLSDSVDLSVPMSGEIKIKYLTFTEKSGSECLKKVGLDSCWVIEVHAGDKWNSDYVIKSKFLSIPGSTKINTDLQSSSKQYCSDSYCSERYLKMTRYSVTVTKKENGLDIVFR